MGDGEKAKDFKKSIKRIILYTKKYLPFIVIALLFSTIATVLRVINPAYLSQITDLISEGLKTGIDLVAINKIGVFLVVIYLVVVILNVSQSMIMVSVNQNVAKKFRNDLSNKINVLPLKYFDNNSYGDILSRISNDVDTVSQVLAQSLSTLLVAAMMFFGTLIIMFATNWIMALSAIFSAFIGFSLIVLITSKSQKFFIRQQELLGEINGNIEENYSGQLIVKISNAIDSTKEEFDKLNKDLYNAAWKGQFAAGIMMPIMGFIGNLSYVVVCIIGAILVINGNIGFGTIIAFMVYIRMFTQPLAQFAQVVANMQSAVAAGERIFEFLDEPELEDESHIKQVLTNVKGDIEFENLKFSYEEGKPIIKDFSAKIKAGQKVAIVGPTGAGKTTLVNLLMRFYEINGGNIKIDGVPISDLSRDNVQSMFGMVLQDTWLFEGTIRENIVFNTQNVSDDEIERVCKLVGLHHFVKTLPKGLETVLDVNTSLSSGQKQLITIARAMIENAPMLILDEATSSIDTRSEILIQKAMDNLTKGRTSFVIAHRLSTIKNADLILVLKDGDIIQSGTHESLLKEGGFYAELYNSQFEKVS
ncbi:MAG: ABC transporter ATP-binding protein [Christensenellaceae bacterium]|nr:ABC transporter ATP-binding protein [Christensenellaceae bacterium]